MGKWFDCSQTITAEIARAFKNDGYEGAIRYLVPDYYTKALMSTEARIITDAGLKLVSVFETYAQRALEGYTAGYADGIAAKLRTVAVGQPAGSTCYFAVDFEPKPSQMPGILDYIRGAAQATPEHPTGVYGNAAVIKACKAAGVCSRYWQTKGWSYGEVVDGIHLYQKAIELLKHGLKYDDNDGAEYGIGWWTADGDIELPPGPFLDVKSDHWNAENLKLLKNAGIITGYEDGMFRGDQPATRHEVAAMIANTIRHLA